MPEERKGIGLITQITIIFVIGVVLIGTISAMVLYRVTSGTVNRDLESRAHATAADIESYINQFPAHDWLLRYWFEHYDEMDIEYDADYDAGTLTAQKYRELLSHHPEFIPDYTDSEMAESLSAEDQKLFAEIMYSWLITRIDHTQAAQGFDYIFCVVTEEPYETRHMLFIAAPEGAERGDEPGQIYPIGKVLGVTETQKEVIRQAVEGTPGSVPNKDGRYLDYYYPLASVDGRELLIGVTRNVESINASVKYSAINFGWMVLVFLAILALACLMMVWFVVLRPLRKVQQGIRLYKDTKDTETTTQILSKIHSGNELGQLSDDVADLTREIDEYTFQIGKISAERERIETELNLAQRIQTAMVPNVFPAFPDRNDFDLYGSVTPAREVGGDFFDFFLIDDDHLCMIIADVSGKGVPAALFVVASKITLWNNVNMGKSPAEIFKDTNEAICRNNPKEMFITVWLGILDLKTGKVVAANAGHEYPIVQGPDGRFEVLKDRHGFVIGGMEDIRYHEYEFELKPGSRLFLHTDGLSEATDPEKEMFGTERILDVLNKEPNASPKKHLANMQGAVKDFIRDAERFDDLTMLCLEYRGAQ